LVTRMGQVEWSEGARAFTVTVDVKLQEFRTAEARDTIHFAQPACDRGAIPRVVPATTLVEEVIREPKYRTWAD
jgi:hypothetical protein